MNYNTTRNLVIAGTILFTSTVSVIYSDINKERMKYRNELNSQLEVNKSLTHSYNKQHELLLDKDDRIRMLNQSLKEKESKIHNLEKQLEKSKKRNESPSYHMTITAYTSGYESTQKHKGDKGYGLTASGTYVKEGRTVACPKFLPFGTRIKIENVGIRVCEDRGQAITTGHVDLYMDDLNDAVEFGKKKLEVEILKEE